MEVLGREHAPFSARVWQEIDTVVNGVKTANCTARRFLEVDGPYGVGLTATTSDDLWLPPAPGGATSRAWGVPQAGPPGIDADPDQLTGRGTSLAYAIARPVPLITSEFILSVRNVEGFDDDCQPLDLARAVRAARDLALEEERLIYYGNPTAGLPGLLTLHNPQPAPPVGSNAGLGSKRTTVDLPPEEDNLDFFYQIVREAVPQLASRGFTGHFALAVAPKFHTMLYDLLPNRDVTLASLLRDVFYMGFHMVPVIQPFDPGDNRLLSLEPVGAVVTAARPYLRLVVGQDWVTAYRGVNGAYHKFIIMCSLRLEVSEPNAVQVLRSPAGP